MMHESIAVAATRHGYPDPLTFYFAGRGGVLGDVDAGVVTAAMGWWEPGVVRAHWEAGLAVAAPLLAAQRYADAAARWGDDHLAGFAGGTAEGSGLPLFSGWRAMPLAEPSRPGSPS